MELRNCPRCGKVFYFIRKNLCLECIKKDEEELMRVKKYIKENPGLSISKIAEETETDYEKILEWVRERSLAVEHIDTSDSLICERCGKPILSGKLCSECYNVFVASFKKCIENTEEKEQHNNSSKVKFHTRSWDKVD